MTEVIVTLRGPALIDAERATLAVTESPTHRLAREQRRALAHLHAAIPSMRLVWRYRIVANGFDLLLPTASIGRLSSVPGIAKVWPVVSYRGLTVRRTTVSRKAALSQGPQVIGADRLWGSDFGTAGNGIRIAILDDGVDARHAYFEPTGFTFAPGYPKGKTSSTTAKVIVQRTFAPPTPAYRYASAPFDPSRAGSFHATHVAGIAAGDHGTTDGSLLLSGVAPAATIGNYKVLTIPTPAFGLDGNSGAIAAAIEAAITDGMDIINLSLGEPEIEPSRDFVVSAIEAASRAGVVSVVAAGNEFDENGYGTISSPASAPSAIAVAASSDDGVIAGFSSAGPTPVSLKLKPDVTAPGVGIVSSLPPNQSGPYGALSGTSMATPQVAGAVALLMQRHPDWTVAQIKSALVQTGGAVRNDQGREVSVLREGGGLIDLVRADDPKLFAEPSSISLPVNGGAVTVALTDAGGGGGQWKAGVHFQTMTRGVTVTTAPSVAVPGSLHIAASASEAARSGNITGFIVLTRGTDRRRIPFWLPVDRPVLGTLAHRDLLHPGIYSATTTGGTTRISSYRYPTAGDGTYPGPEVVYRVRLSHLVANFGVAVLSGHVEPHVVFTGSENHLVGNAGMPLTLNPYLDSWGEARPVAGSILPASGVYDIVFDTRTAAEAGSFTFRFWTNDTTPPRIAMVSHAHGTIVVSVTDAGSGVDPKSVRIRIDGEIVSKRIVRGALTLPVQAGSHRLSVTASDYQELKNMEDVPTIKPNTSTLTTTVTVPA